jgi:hypothetical protein
VGGSEIRSIESRTIEYWALPSQKRFHESPARFKGFSGPIGSGKSQALCQEAIKLSYLGLSYTYQVVSGDTLDDIVAAITGGMNGPTSPFLTATQTGTTIRVFYPSAAGANGNRFGIYSSTSGSAVWDAAAKTLANGTSPTKWRVTIDFSSLVDRGAASVPTNKVRKLRWAFAADLQTGAFERCEFAAVISNWSVSGTGRTYSVAGSGSQRFEDSIVAYSGSWTETRGNYSGGSIHSTTTEGDAVTFQYAAAQTHTLYVGTRYMGNGARISIVVDGGTASTVNLRVPGEDVLIRWSAGEFGIGTHTVTIAHAGPAGADFYFDFLELAVPVTTLPTFSYEPRMTLATDWDTDHSIALAPERTAWLIETLGFKGRQNHYAGALWFYELANPDNVYAAGTVTFGGTPEPGQFVSIFLARDDDPAGTSPTEIQRGMHGGDTPQTIAISYAQEVNHGYTGVWASVSGSVVTVYARSLGADGNHYTLGGSTTSRTLTVSVSATFSGGNTGLWRTDLTATPRLNRAVRDWNRSFFTALGGYGIDVVTAFSTELRDVDPAVGVGMVQRGPAATRFFCRRRHIRRTFHRRVWISGSRCI